VVKSLIHDSVTLNEKIFLSSSISQSILAVAIENHSLAFSQVTRVFVVDQKEQAQ